MSVRTEMKNWINCAAIHRKCDSAACITSLYLCIGSLKDILSSAVTVFFWGGGFLFMDEEDELIKKKFLF